MHLESLCPLYAWDELSLEVLARMSRAEHIDSLRRFRQFAPDEAEDAVYSLRHLQAAL